MKRIFLRFIYIIIVLLYKTAQVANASTICATNNYGCGLIISGIQDGYVPLEPILLSMTLKNKINDFLYITDDIDFRSIKSVTRNNKEIELTNYGIGLLANSAFGSKQAIRLRNNETYESTIALNRLYDLTDTGTYDVKIEVLFAQSNNKNMKTRKFALNFSIVIISSKEYGYYLSRTHLGKMTIPAKLEVYNILEVSTTNKLKEQLCSKDTEGNVETIRGLAMINSKKSIPILLENIDMEFINGSQTNYPCFEALKKMGVSFNIFTNELNHIELGTMREKLLNNLGQNLYGDIFQLYLEQDKSK